MTTWYRTGTVGVTNASTAVTGSGTAWVANVRIGDAFHGPDGRIYEVATVVSNTALTLVSAYGGSTAGAQAYAVQPTRGIIRDFDDTVRAWLDVQQDYVDGALAGRFGDGTEAQPGLAFGDDIDTGFRRTGANEMTLVIGGTDRITFANDLITYDEIARFNDGIIFSGVAGEKISLIGNRFDSTNGYIIGAEGAQTYFKAPGGYNWYASANADDGASAIMQLLNGFGLYLDGFVEAAGTYSGTTGAGANVFVNTNGRLLRSTSSLRYKTDVEDLEPSYRDTVLDMRPVWYRSTCDEDDPAWSYYGLIAEEVAALDPRLVHWGPDDEGELQAEGVMYERIVPHLIALAQQQQDEIAALKARVDALETA